MPAACVPEFAADLVEHAIPCREVEIVVLLHRERPVERPKDLRRHSEISIRKRLGSKRVEHRYRQQRRADAMAANIEQVHREMVLVDPMIAERVAAQLKRGDKTPVRTDAPFAYRRGSQG